MNQRALFFFISAVIGLQVHAQTKTSMHFNVQEKWEKNHSGSDDLTIKEANYWVEDNQVHMEILIQDDELLFDSNKISSDHIEIWFTALENTHQVIEIANFDEGIYTDWNFVEFDHEDDTTLAQKKATYFEYEKENLQYYGYFDESELIDLELKDVNVSRDLSGTAHYGFFKDNSLVFDQANAYSLGLTTTTQPKYTLVPTENGYRFKAVFSAEDLFIVKQFPINDIKCEVVVFDADKSGLSVHTFGNQYQWGIAEHFKLLNFKPGLQADVPQEWQWFTQSESAYSWYGIFNGNEWTIQLLDYYRDHWYDRSAYISWVDISPKYGYFQTEQDSVVYFYTGSQETQYPFDEGANLLYIPSKQIWLRTDRGFNSVNDSAFIEFDDGSWGFLSYAYYLQNPYGHGPCGSCEHEQLTIYRINGAEKQPLIEIDANMGNIETWWPDDWTISRQFIPDFDSMVWNPEEQTFHLIVFDEWEGEEYYMSFTFDEEWLPYVASFGKISDEIIEKIQIED